MVFNDLRYGWKQIIKRQKLKFVKNALANRRIGSGALPDLMMDLGLLKVSLKSVFRISSPCRRL